MLIVLYIDNHITSFERNRFLFLISNNNQPHSIDSRTLQWRHDECDGIPNHWRVHCLLNRLCRRRSKKTSELRVTGLCGGEFAGDRWIPRWKGKGSVTRRCFHLMTSSWQFPFSCRLWVCSRSIDGILVRPALVLHRSLNPFGSRSLGRNRHRKKLKVSFPDYFSTELKSRLRVNTMDKQ